MKVLFFIHNMEDGGAQKVLTQLVNSMNPEQFDITVLSLFGGGVNERFLRPSVRYKCVFPHMIRGNKFLQLLFPPALLHRLCIKEHYDVEISYLEGISARIISGCRDSTTKLISWIHCTFHSEEEAGATFRNFQEAQRQYGTFDRIVCVAEQSQKAFTNYFPDCSASTGVLYNTLDSNEILRLSGENASDFVINREEISIVSVGSLKAVKAFDRLIRIHTRLRAEGYPVHTYLLGQGPDEKILKQQVAENGCADSFTFLGYQSNPYQYVSKSDLFVCSSLSEGFSTAATEALIVGTPVCTVEVSGMKEMLGEHDEYGIVTDNDEEALYQGIKALLDDPEKLAHYKKQAELRGKDFSAEKTTAAVEEMLLNL